MAIFSLAPRQGEVLEVEGVGGDVAVGSTLEGESHDAGFWAETHAAHGCPCRDLLEEPLLCGEVAHGGHVVCKEEEAKEEPESFSFEEARGGAAVVGKEGDLVAVGILFFFFFYCLVIGSLFKVAC